MKNEVERLMKGRGIATNSKREKLEITTKQREELFGITQGSFRKWRSGYGCKDGKMKVDAGRCLLFYAIDELTPEQIEKAKERQQETMKLLGCDENGYYTPKSEDK